MNVLVIDVAAEYGGAVTILEQFLSSFEKQKENNYIVVLGKLKYQDRTNISVVNFEWVKKSYIHRLYFDRIVVPKLVRKNQPDMLISLQNNAFALHGVRQQVYFQNALPISENKIRFFQSKKMWFYQNVIGNIVRYSLKYADEIIVQAEWIKTQLSAKWKIDSTKIYVLKPHMETIKAVKEYHPKALFYPATGYIYKNHITLLNALQRVWEKSAFPELRLTGKLEDLPLNCQTLIRNNNYPIKFLGKLSFEEMIAQYATSILVFPSYIETVGLPLIEAKAIGSKIIVADCEYAHEAIGEYDKVDYFSALESTALTSIIEKNCKYYNIVK